MLLLVVVVFTSSAEEVDIAVFAANALLAKPVCADPHIINTVPNKTAMITIAFILMWL
jgi:hypothetical protein